MPPEPQGGDLSRGKRERVVKRLFDNSIVDEVQRSPKRIKLQAEEAPLDEAPSGDAANNAANNAGTPPPTTPPPPC